MDSSMWSDTASTTSLAVLCITFVHSNMHMHLSCLPAALRAVQICRYLVYSEADFEVFRPAGATSCTDGGTLHRSG